MLNCAIIGATGYTGAELARILLRHPHVHVSGLTTRQKEKIPLGRLIPALPREIDLEIRPFSFAEIRRSTDVVFLCLPHTEAMRLAPKFLEAGKIVIDLSADFRLQDWKEYEKWYGVKHTNRQVLKEAVYGLPELYRENIRRSNLIANPGCYPTGIILGIAPLLHGRCIETDSLIIDAKSGVTGAGKKLNPATQFCEVDENFYAYKVGRHQHTPEIEQVLSDVTRGEIRVTFVPHLLPLERGILTTIYLRRKKSVRREAIREAFRNVYREEPFIRLKPEGTFPALKDVQRTNYCDIGFWTDPDSERIIVITAIDNLVKGAAGQAVQNLNVRAGFREDEGLKIW